MHVAHLFRMAVHVCCIADSSLVAFRRSSERNETKKKLINIYFPRFSVAIAFFDVLPFGICIVFRIYKLSAANIVICSVSDYKNIGRTATAHHSLSDHVTFCFPFVNFNWCSLSCVGHSTCGKFVVLVFSFSCFLF